MNQETKEQREIAACQDQGDHQDHQERQEETVLMATPVMLDQEESLDKSGQRETLVDLALTILDQEDHREREERRATVDLEAAEETVAQRVNLDLKEHQERQVNQGLRVNLDEGDQGVNLGVTEILVLRETLASQNVMS